MSLSPITKPTDIDELPFKFDCSKIKLFVDELNGKSWEEFDFRQKAFEVHRSTNSIPLLWIPLDVRSFDPKQQQPHELLYNSFYSLSLELLTFLSSYFKGKIFKILLAKLSPQSEIPLHYDCGFSLTFTHRIHIPIISNDKVFFTVNGRTINMQEGHLYEINNQTLHGVSNQSKADRVHVIIDVIEDKTIRECNT